MKKALLLALLVTHFELLAQTPPTITVNPQSRTRTAGTSVVFTVSATGTAPLSYQWQQNGFDLFDDGFHIFGADKSSLTVLQVSDYDAGDYTATVYNDYGADYSSAATLTVLEPPIIVQQPSDVAANIGEYVSFYVTAEGTEPLSYQWKFNNSNISGATDSELDINSVQIFNDGVYTVVVSNAVGSVTSQPALLSVLLNCQPAPGGLMSWWKADGSTEDALGVNNGTFSGSPSYNSGEVGSAFRFDGNNYFQAGTSGFPTGNNSRTLECWVNLANYPENEAFIAGYGNFGSSGQSFYLGVQSDGTVFFSQWGKVLTGPQLTLGNWSHVAAVFGGGTATIYVDGSYYDSTNLTLSTPSTGTFYAGRIPGTLGDSRKLDGLVDDIRVYNQAISDSDLASIYYAGNSGLCDVSRITSYYLLKFQRFDQNGAGTPTASTNGPFQFRASARVTYPLNAITNGFVKRPNGTTDSLGFDEDDGVYFKTNFNSLASMNSVYPNGSYTLTLKGPNIGTKNVPLTFPADAYPNAPHVSNYSQAQAVDYSQDFVLAWDAFTGGTTNDAIVFSVADENDEYDIITAGRPGDTNTINGTATSFTIPRYTLEPGKTYTVRVAFAKVVATNTTTIPGALGVAAFVKQTDLRIKTLSNYSYFVVSKGKAYEQTGTNAPVLAAGYPYEFFAAAGQRDPFAYDITNVFVEYNPYTLTVDGPNFGYEPLFTVLDPYDTQAQLDSTYPNGTYRLVVQGYTMGEAANTVTLSGSRPYPNAPRIANFNGAQSINPGANFTLSWDSFSGGTTNDLIRLEIDDDYGPVFQTPFVAGGSIALLNGKSNSVVIPAYTLRPGRTYYGYLVFAAITSPASANGPRSIAGYFSETKFSLKTANGAGVFAIANSPQAEFSLNAAFSGQNYLVGIQGIGSDHSAVGAQLVSASGAVIGPVISTGHTGSTPRVAFDGLNYLLVWSDDSNYPYDDIYGQFIDTTGYPVGDVFPISQASGKQDIQGLIFDGANYVAIWEDDRDGFTTIYGQAIDPSGNLIGDEVPICDDPGVSQRAPAITANTNNTEVLIVWQSKRSGVPERWDVWGRFFNSVDGLNTSAAGYQISQTTSARYNPLTVTAGRTNYLVVWNRDVGSGFPNPAQWDLYGRLIMQSGAFQGNEFPVVTAGGNQILPFSAFDGNNYLVSWTDGLDLAGPSSPTSTAKARFYSQSGTTVGPEVILFRSIAGSPPLAAPILFDGTRYFAVGTLGSIGSSHSLISGDVYGSFLSSAAPMVGRSPRSQFVALGETVALSASVSGPEPIQYQWTFNGSNLAGRTVNPLIITNVSYANEGTYVLVIKNPAGTVTTEPAVINVLAKPAITLQPVTQTSVPVSNTVTFTVQAIGGTPLFYQWRLNGQKIPGATDSSYTIDHVQLIDSGNYSVVVANAVGSVNSANAFLSVAGPALPFSDNFSARVTTNSASGFGKGNNLAATFEFGEPQHAGKGGGHSVWLAWQAPADGVVIFTARGSTFDTLMAVYTGTDLASLTRVAADDDSGGFFTSTVRFNAVAGTQYQIAIDGLAGATGNIVLSWFLDQSGSDYPMITKQPLSQTVTNGATVTFEVEAQSQSALTYQWYFADQPLPDATDSTLTLEEVDTNWAGVYRVEVGNASTSVLSLPAVLEIGSSDSSSPSEDKFEDVIAGATHSVRYLPVPGGTRGASVTAGAVGTQLLNNVGATKETCEPNHADAAGGSSRWFTLQLEDTGTLVLDTIGSDFDTVLAVYTGTNLCDLTYVASDDNSAPDGMRSQLSFTNATRGKIYAVAVDGYDGAEGNIVLNWRLGLLPFIAQAPKNQPAQIGTNIVLSVVASNSPIETPLTYQWKFNGQEMPGETYPVLNINNLQEKDCGNYQVLVGNYIGAVTRTAAVFLDAAPQIEILSPVADTLYKGSATIPIETSVLGVNLTKVEFFAGTKKLGLKTNEPYNLTVSNLLDGTYLLTAKATDSLGRTNTSSAVRISVDATKPKVAITAPKTGNRSTNPIVKLLGTASDNMTVADLSFQLNSNSFVSIPIGTTNNFKWTNAVTLTPGTNTVRVRCADLAGNESIVTNTYFCIVSNRLTLITNLPGMGTITRTFKGMDLEIGRGYQLTGKPANPMIVFSNWLGNNGINSSSNVLNFIMESNLTITANFATNPFPQVKGTYNGLFHEDEIKVQSAGFFTFTVTDQGVLSGKVNLSNAPLSFTGKFNLDGVAQAHVARVKNTPLDLRFEIDLLTAGTEIHGTATDGTWVADVLGDRAGTNPVFAGKYNLVLPGTNNPAVGPGGDSFGSVTVTKSSVKPLTLALLGTLADGLGTTISQSVNVSPEGRWPLYVPLYKGAGVLLSWVNFNDSTGGSFAGDFSWIKLRKSTDKFYPSGFTNEDSVLGSTFTNTPRLLALTNGTITYSGGNLATIVQEITMTPKNIFQTNSGTNKLSLGINTAGQFTGTFLHPATGKSTPIKGAILQQQNLGRGFFLGTNQTGKILIEAD